MDPYSVICLVLRDGHMCLPCCNYGTFHYTNTNVTDFTNPFLFPPFSLNSSGTGVSASNCTRTHGVNKSRGYKYSSTNGKGKTLQICKTRDMTINHELNVKVVMKYYERTFSVQIIVVHKILQNCHL